PPPPSLHSFPTRRSSDLFPLFVADERVRIPPLVELTAERTLGDLLDLLQARPEVFEEYRLAVVLPYSEGLSEEIELDAEGDQGGDRKSTRLNSSHVSISY